MPISDLPILSMLRTKMHWHQERQRLLAENVANADTPKFRPRDLAPVDFGKNGPAGTVQGGTLQLAATDPAHIGAAPGGTRFANATGGRYDIRPTGNAVNLEDEMMKVSANQMDYQAATSLYSRSMGLFRTALGKR
jgi:flagellar basal-body rod protein FlgB